MNVSTVKIESLLATQGMTKKELAERTGISLQSISTITKRGTCTPISAGKLAAALGCDVSDIIENHREGESNG